MEAVLLHIIAKGTASGWTLCLIGLVGLIILAKILAAQRPAMKKMAIDEGAAIRAEYAAEMKALREEIRGLRVENDKLREEIRDLHDMLAGMRRQNLQDQASIIRSVPAVQEAIAEAATRAVRASEIKKP